LERFTMLLELKKTVSMMGVFEMKVLIIKYE
jgi:hypothetical protein